MRYVSSSRYDIDIALKELNKYARLAHKYCTYTRGQIDTARTYSGGTSEEYLGKIDWKKRGLVMDTKLYPNAVSPRLLCAHTTRSSMDVRSCHPGSDALPGPRYR